MKGVVYIFFKAEFMFMKQETVQDFWEFLGCRWVWIGPNYSFHSIIFNLTTLFLYSQQLMEKWKRKIKGEKKVNED